MQNAPTSRRERQDQCDSCHRSRNRKTRGRLVRCSSRGPIRDSGRRLGLRRDQRNGPLIHRVRASRLRHPQESNGGDEGGDPKHHRSILAHR